MGIWAYTIFGNDTTCDIRDEFEGLIKVGHTPEEAANNILQSYGSEMKSYWYYESVIYLALAYLQFRAGSVSPEIKNKALEIIDERRVEITDPHQAKLRDEEFEVLKAMLLNRKLSKGLKIVTFDEIDDEVDEEN